MIESSLLFIYIYIYIYLECFISVKLLFVSSSLSLYLSHLVIYYKVKIVKYSQLLKVMRYLICVVLTTKMKNRKKERNKSRLSIS